MIPIYKYEIDGGLSDIIKSNSTVALTSIPKIVSSNVDDEKRLISWLKSEGIANPKQLDLFYLESILASVGINKNDDFFDKIEVWNARNTPVDKQFNFMHNEKDIIGHITSAKVVDSNGKLILDDTFIDDLPDNFDVVVGSVLYKKWSDPELSSRMQKIIAEIINGQWHVSMECLFRDFDYVFMQADGECKVKKRDKNTAFLTKHLRIYGGTGEYEGYKIGRLLRNFTFSGKGLVDNPANPRSDITSFNNSLETTSFAKINFSNEDENMADSATVLKVQYDALKAELDEAKAELKEIKKASSQEVEKQVNDLNDKIDELTQTKSSLETELEASKEVANAKEEKIQALETELKEVKEQLTEANNKIKQAELEATKASRKAMLLEKVDESKAEVLVEKFVNASDDMFNALVESLPAKVSAKDKMEKEEEEDKEEDKKEKESKASEEDSVEDGTDLDDAKAEDDIDVSNSDDDETLRSKASSWFVNNVLRSTAKSK